MPNSAFKSLFNLWLWQWAVAGLCAALASLWDGVIAYSVMLGALVFWLPNAWFGLSAFRFRMDQSSTSVDGEVNEERALWQARLLTHNVFRGEMNKFMLNAIGFALVFSLVKPLEGLAVFAAFVLLTFVQWIVVSRWQIQ